MSRPWWQWPSSPKFRIIAGAVITGVAVVGLLFFKPAWPSLLLGVGIVYLVIGSFDLIKQRRGKAKA